AFQPCSSVQVLLLQIALGVPLLGREAAAGGDAAMQVLARQQACCERVARQQAGAVLLPGGNELGTTVGHDETVFGLARDEPTYAQASSGALRMRKLRGREVRAPYKAHLALLHQIFERAQRLLDRGVRIRVMHLV